MAQTLPDHHGVMLGLNSPLSSIGSSVHADMENPINNSTRFGCFGQAGGTSRHHTTEEGILLLAPGSVLETQTLPGCRAEEASKKKNYPGGHPGSSGVGTAGAWFSVARPEGSPGEGRKVAQQDGRGKPSLPPLRRLPLTELTR